VAGLTVWATDIAALLFAIALGAALLTFTVRWARGSERHALSALVALAVSTHMATALVLQAMAPGFITGDDAAYFRIASQAASYLHGIPAEPNYGPPLWGGDAYLFGGFVYLETALFFVFGPDVRIPLLLNAAMAVATALLIYASAARLFGVRAALLAAAIVSFYPSLILWSSLNLKDALTNLLLALGVGGVIAFQARPRVVMFIVALLSASILETVRGYAATTLAVAVTLSLIATPLSGPRRIAIIAIAGLVAVLIALQTLSSLGTSEGDLALERLEYERAAMAVGARTGFVPTPTPVVPTPTPVVPTPTPVVPTPTGVVQTAPADRSTPSPTETLATAVRETPTPSALMRTLTYLPVGIASAILAPVPFASGGIRELVVAPEMLCWYALVAAALATTWRERRRLMTFAAAPLVIGGLILVFALTEGNVGTLFRHRGMIVPFVALLASPALIDAWGRLTRRV
jgi:hypothetical protein